MYKCNSCKINLCPVCKSSHEELHNIINYDLNNYICELHNEKYISYCQNCKKNTCILCTSEHNNHDLNIYKILDKNRKIMELNELRNIINKFYRDIKNIINKLNKVLKNIEIYYDICNNIIINYDMKKMNDEKLENLNQIINDDILNDLNNIINDNNINNKFKKIIEINNKMKKEEEKKEIIYNLNDIKLMNNENLNNKNEIMNENIMNNNFKENIQIVLQTEIEPMFTHTVQPIIKNDIKSVVKAEIKPMTTKMYNQ